MDPNPTPSAFAAANSHSVAPHNQISASEFRRARRHAFIAAGSASALFLLGTWLFARLGGPWVDSLDERLGEVLAQRAAGALLAEDFEDAFGLYEAALKAGFQDQDHEVWVRQDYATALINAGRPNDALRLAVEIVESRVRDISDWVGRKAFSRIQAAYAASGDYEAALAAASAWFEAGARVRRGELVCAQAKYYAGVALQALGRHEEAGDAFEAAFALNPTPQIAKAAADALTRLGREEEARRYLTVGAP